MFKYLVTFFFVLLIPTSSLSAATRTWDGGGSTNDWSECANWSSDTCPVAADTAVFNSTSVKNSTVDAGFGGQLTTLNINSGYTGTTTLASALTLTGSFTQAAGTMDLGGQLLSVASAFTLTGGTFRHSNGTVTFNGTSSATISCNNASFYLVTFENTAGTKTVNSTCNLPLGTNPVISSAGSVTVQGTLSGSGTLTKTAGALSLTGAGNISSFSGLVFNSFTIGGATLNASSISPFTVNATFTFSSGSFTAPALLTLNGIVNISGGTFNHNNGTVAFGGIVAGNIGCNNASFNLVSFTNTDTGTKTINSNCTLPLGTNPTTSVGSIINNGVITADGTWTVQGNLTNASGTINFSGTTIDFKKNFSQLGTADFSGKTLSFTGNGSLLTCSGTLGGTVIVNLVSGSFVNSSGCTISLGGSPTTAVTDHFTNNGTIQVSSGEWSVSTDGSSERPFATVSAMGADLSGLTKWRGGVLASNNKIYTFPQDATDILIIDPVAGTSTRSSMGADLSGTQKWYGGVLASNGKIYSVPVDAQSVLIIDPTTETATTSNFGLDLSDTLKWVHGVLGSDGRIYGVPFNATDIIIVDPVAGTSTRSSLGADLSGSGKWRDGVRASNGKIYGIPYNASDILIIDTIAGTSSRSTMGVEFTGTVSTKYSTGILGPNGKIYGIPQQGNKILIIDPATDTATTSTMGVELSGTQKWAGAVVGSDNKIYATPFDSTDFLVIDTATETATRSNFGADVAARWIGAVRGPDDKIYGIPNDATNILVIDFVTPQFSNAGTISHNGSTWSLNSFSLANSSSGTITAPSGITSLTGNWDNDGVFNANSGTVSLTGQNQELSGSTTFNNLTKITTSLSTLLFEADTTQTILGTLRLEGATGQPLSLRSSSSGTAWKIDPQSTRSLSYLDVKDSNNINSTTIAAHSSNITNSGNNTGWTFTAPAATSIGGGGYFISTPPIANQPQETIPTSPSTNENTPSSTSSQVTTFTFLRNLSYGTTRQDVLELQKYLNKNGFLITTKGSGSPGNETTFFGLLTRAALIKFQEAYKVEILIPYGLTKGTGYFGVSTRNFINTR